MISLYDKNDIPALALNYLVLAPTNFVLTVSLIGNMRKLLTLVCTDLVSLLDWYISVCDGCVVGCGYVGAYQAIFKIGLL